MFNRRRQNDMRLVTLVLVTIWLLVEQIRCKSLKDNPRCNILKLCNTRKGSDTTPSELDLLECVVHEKLTDFTVECKQFVFDYAVDYFKDNNLRRSLNAACVEEIKALTCKNGQKLIFCILEQKEKLTDYYCQHVVHRLEYLISSNFALVSDFNSLCVADIRRLCNRQTPQENWQVVQESSSILDCLQKRIDLVNNTSCQREILYLSEIQGENYRLDRNLLTACTFERVNFCSDVAGNAEVQIYKCLQEFSSNPSMSVECREQLFKREKLISKDLKISKGLVRACREDIRKNRCRRMISDDKSIRLAQMLLCLENAIHNGTKITGDCRSEMIRHRKSLMEDYRLSPEVVSKCSDDINELCSSLEKGGKTIHCLLENSRPREHRQKTVSSGCQRALENLLKVADAGENWRVDPVLRRACERAVRNLCSEARGDETKVMSCLVDNLNSGAESMGGDCVNAVLQIQYFVARDFKLDPLLFEACHGDAVKLCHAKRSWNDESGTMDPERGPLVLPCLYRYLYNYDSDNPKTKIKIKPECAQQVRRVMRQRAIKAELIPEVEESCIDDLVTYCSEKTGPGEEMLCLQDKYTSLKSKCKAVVGNFTEAEASDVNLNPIVKMYCGLVINLHCKEELNSKDGPNDVMSCLVRHKNDEDVKLHYKCRAAIEHFQLISLNDYHFTVAFKDACRPYVIHYCPKAHTKAQVVECLSEVTQNDTLKEERYKLSKECRYQLRAQLLQQREFIDLDPKLKSACESDVNSLCKNVNQKSEILECLEEKINSLSPQCHKMVFRIEQHDFKDSSSDYTLLTTCKSMIKAYCDGKNTSQALMCLKSFKDEPVFDSNCRSLVLKRMVEQSADYRLNPALQRGCGPDIGKFCFALLENHLPDKEYEGKILNCLKIKFRERKLRKECESQLSAVLKEAALNYKLNPLLRNLCAVEIESQCSSEAESEKREHSGLVEECLKVAFTAGRIVNRACRLEVAGLIEEAKADIHVDPLLHRACALDIKNYCEDIPPGAGRIIQCLQVFLSDSKHPLQPDCKFKLTQRMEMFQNAERSINSEPKNFKELINHVKRSPSEVFFIISFLSIFGVIFMLGLFLGRVSRRYTAIKNK